MDYEPKYLTKRYIVELVVKIPIPNTEKQLKKFEKALPTEIKRAIRNAEIDVCGLFGAQTKDDDFDIYAVDMKCTSIGESW